MKTSQTQNFLQSIGVPSFESEYAAFMRKTLSPQQPLTQGVRLAGLSEFGTLLDLPKLTFENFVSDEEIEFQVTAWNDLFEKEFTGKAKGYYVEDLAITGNQREFVVYGNPEFRTAYFANMESIEVTALPEEELNEKSSIFGSFSSIQEIELGIKTGQIEVEEISFSLPV